MADWRKKHLCHIDFYTKNSILSKAKMIILKKPDVADNYSLHLVRIQVKLLRFVLLMFICEGYHRETKSFSISFVISNASVKF